MTASLPLMAPNTDSRSQNEETEALLPKQGPSTLEQRHHRNQSFSRRNEPFKDNRSLQLNGDEVDGALWFMNPTRATFSYLGNAEGVYDDQGSEEYQGYQESARRDSRESDIEYKWTSRNNRKGRHSLVVHERSDGSSDYDTGIKSVLSGVWRMWTQFNFWDISYVTAIVFTLAVIILLGNAVLSVIPYINPSWKPPQEIIYVEGALTLAGCCFFLLSSFLSWLEALNADRRGCFGWKMEEVSSQDATVAGAELGGKTRLIPDWNCIHKRNNYSNLFNDSNDKDEYDSANEHDHSTSTGNGKGSKAEWRWFAGFEDLRTHFIYDLGFVTCSILLCSSIVYCTAAAASFISILQIGSIANWIRVPQFIAGIGFTIASILFMLETQTHWLVPEWRVLGWHISFWNFIGSIGFTLCAAFAMISAMPEAYWAEYQLAYSYLWGLAGFLLGSLIQWYEALDKHPVETKKDEA